MNAIEYFEMARAAVIEEGYADEIDWTRNVRFEDTTPEIFAREACWVILCSGFRWAVAQKLWAPIKNAFSDFNDLAWVCKNAERVKTSVLRAFKNERKVEAMISVCQRVSLEGDWPIISAGIEIHGIGALMMFPMIGPVTSYHLARNIGLDVAKPDRHLSRLAEAFGYETNVQAFCLHIAEATGERIGVVDVILWRFAVRHPDYIKKAHARNGAKETP